MYHKQAWLSFERILMYRATIAQVMALLYFVAFYLLGTESSIVSEKFLEEGDPANPDL